MRCRTVSDWNQRAFASGVSSDRSKEILGIMASTSDGGDELGDGEARGTHAASQRPAGHLLVVGSGQGRRVLRVNQNDMAVTLPGDCPAEGGEDLDNFAPAEQRRGRHQTVTST